MASSTTIQSTEPNIKQSIDAIPEPSQSLPRNKPVPSSSTDGFFQDRPSLLPQIQDDLALQRAFSLFLSSEVSEELRPDLNRLATEVLSRPILDLVADSEKNPPYLKTWDTWGRRKDDLFTSEGWRKLSALGQAEGMVGIGYENAYGQYSRPWQFCKYLVWAPSGAWTTCPNLMTDGVAVMLRRQLSVPVTEDEGVLGRRAMQSAYERLTSRDPEIAWTTGQWMTERQGGSDVSQTETLATFSQDVTRAENDMVGTDGVPLGPWLINGFKWFSSATDSQMMVFLARTEKGISTFMAPMRRKHTDNRTLSNGEETELNGVQIQRLKNKLGTRALPTAELVLKDVRAHLVGEEGKGVKEIATVLNVARVHNAMTAIGLWGRGLSAIRAFARVRKVGLKPLWSKPAFTRMLAKMHVDYKANVLFCIFVATLLGVIEQPQIAEYRQATGTSAVGPPVVEATAALPDPAAAETLYRLLASVLKGLTAKSAIAGLAECMEAMGGVGYLENDDMQYNIARLYRDANVCSIWEGTTDMMSHDVLRVMRGKLGKETLSVMSQWIDGVLGPCKNMESELRTVQSMWRTWKSEIQEKEGEELELRSRELMERLGDVVMGTLLVLDASRDEDQAAKDALRSWLASRSQATAGDWRSIVAREKRIVFGTEDLEPERAML